MGFAILDLVGLRVDCMSMVASHGQCHASSSVCCKLDRVRAEKRKYRSIVWYACVTF